MKPEARSKSKSHKWQRRLGWFGVIVSVVVNGALFFALAHVNRQMEPNLDDVRMSAIEFYIPPAEIEPPSEEPERMEFVQKADEPMEMEPMEAIVAPMAILPRIPTMDADIFDPNALAVSVSDVAVSTPASFGPMQMQDVDQPPRRRRGSPTDYPYWARSKGLEARLTVAFTVEANGKVTSVRVTHLEGDERFRSHAIETVKKWRFDPGSFRSKNVPVLCSQELRFRIKG